MAACGELPDHYSEHLQVDPWVDKPTVCEGIACDERNTRVDIPAPTPRVFVDPDQVMFFGDRIALQNLQPREVRVQNATMSAVLVLDAYIQDDTTIASGSDADQYFSVDFERADDPMRPGDFTSLVVLLRSEFAPSISAAHRGKRPILHTTGSSCSCKASTSRTSHPLSNALATNNTGFPRSHFVLF